MHDKAMAVIIAYGGKDNIANIDACLTKLRVQVKDKSLVKEDDLKSLGALGITHPSPQSVYSVFGQEADVIKTTMREIIAKGEIIADNKPQENIEVKNDQQEQNIQK
jgi:glucose-like phosphotransferase system IIB component